MIIDTKKRVIRIQLRRFITLLSVLTLILLVIFLANLLGINKLHWSLGIAILYIITIIAERLLQYTYIFYSDETDKIILRYFSLSFFSKNKKSIEIPKLEYSSFVVKNSLFGLKKKVILRRFYKNGEADYPAVPLTILNKNEFTQLKLSLEKFSKK